ncbi:MAG: anthranilate synthase component I [Blastocatellia bacterium]|nr:anthranilate synthase component I [Blastocatellia bacterium]
MAYKPKNLEEFTQLASNSNLVAVTKTIAADLLTPVAAYLRLSSGSTHSFLLESVEGGEKVARYSFLGIDPHLILRARGRQIEIVEAGQVRSQKGDFFDIVRQIFNRFKPSKMTDLPMFTGGAVGYIGYDAVRWFEDIPDKNPDSINIEDAVLMFFSSILAFDHVKRQIVIIVNAFKSSENSSLETLYQNSLNKIAQIENLLTLPIALPAKRPRTYPPSIRSNFTKEQFENAVEKAKEYIKAGDIFQVVLSQRFEIDIVTHPFQIYRAVRMVNPSPYMFYLSMGEITLAGASPEMLVRCTSRRLDYRPIAGTRPRGTTDVEDALAGEELRADEKEVAEHIMLVDLGRNDLGRVSDYGSIEILEMMVIERYSHVMHMVSSLRGRLHSSKDRFDALQACFPAGTVSGAPKVRAMEIIDELEPTQRSFYAGTVLYLDYAGNLDSCITIRSVLVKDGKAYIQAGAGIVADSVAEKEYIETVNKARALLKAIEVAEKEL